MDINIWKKALMAASITAGMLLNTPIAYSKYIPIESDPDMHEPRFDYPHNKKQYEIADAILQTTSAVQDGDPSIEELIPDSLKEFQLKYSTPRKALAGLRNDYEWEAVPDPYIYGKEFAASPLVSFEKRKGDCEDSAMLLAFALMDDGYHPFILATVWDDSRRNHMLYAFQGDDGKWGYANLGAGGTLQYQDATLESPADIAKYYRQYQTPGWKEGLEYYLIDLDKVIERGVDWRITDLDLLFYPSDAQIHGSIDSIK